MRYYIVLYNRVEQDSLGAAVVDAESEEEAMKQLPNLEGYPGQDSNTEAMIFVLSDDDPQGQEMLGKYLDADEMRLRYPRPDDFLNEVPDDFLPDVARIMSDHLRSTPEFLGSHNPDGTKRNASILDELDRMVATSKGQIH